MARKRKRESLHDDRECTDMGKNSMFWEWRQVSMFCQTRRIFRRFPLMIISRTEENETSQWYVENFQDRCSHQRKWWPRSSLYQSQQYNVLYSFRWHDFVPIKIALTVQLSFFVRWIWLVYNTKLVAEVYNLRKSAVVFGLVCQRGRLHFRTES